MILYRFLAFVILVLGVVYLKYKEVELLSNKDYSKLEKNPEIYISSIGYNKKLGNIVGIQTFMVPADYSNEERFFKKLETYILEAQRNGFLSDKSIVVFPEHIGTPLVLLEEEKSLYYQNSLEDVIKILTKNYFFLNYQKSKESFTIQKLFIYKSKKMKDVYVRTFSQLSKFYNITILAGSIFLPNPKLNGSEIFIEGEELKNVSFIFSYGKLLPIFVEKYRLSNFEDFTRNAQASNFTVYQIPNLNTSFLILLSNDSLYNQNYESNAEIVISPSAVYEKQKILWQDPAISDNPKSNRSLFTEEDKNLSQVELWQKFGLAGKFSYLTSKIYLQVFLRGEFFGNKFIGNSSMGYRYLKIETTPSNYLASILNIYL